MLLLMRPTESILAEVFRAPLLTLWGIEIGGVANHTERSSLCLIEVQGGLLVDYSMRY